jgi:DNA-3-methyladenine glycosylase II
VEKAAPFLKLAPVSNEIKDGHGKMNHNSQTIVQPACAHLASADPAFAALIARIGPCLLPITPREPYEALIRAIAHQQLHARAAENILGRFVALYPDHDFPPPDHVLATDDAALRSCGFSGSKAAAIRDIAARRLDGTVPGHTDAALLEDGALIERLTTIRGVGRWTVEMLLIFTFGRPDILPVDDFGVREGWRRIQGLDAQPRPKALAVLGEAWAPYRSTAAWYLWRAADEGKRVKTPKPTVAPAPEMLPASLQKPRAARRGASVRRP